MSIKALVIGEDTRSFLSVIRSLGKKAYDVDVVCFDRQSPSLASRYIHNSFYLNYQAYTQDQWLQALISIVKEHTYDIVMPCDERAIFPLYENQHLFPATCRLGIPNQAVLEHLFDKDKTKQVAIQCDVPIARGEIVKLKQCSFTQLQQNFGDKFVVKPTLSFKSEDLAKRQKVEIIESSTQLAHYCRYIDASDEYLIEEYFSGVGEGISLFAINGKVQHFFAHTRVNEPRSGGGSSYRKAIALNQDMAQACERICAHTQYDGVGMFEFKKHPLTQAWILIEVNARFWGSLPLAVYAGIDFPGDYADYLLGQYTPLNTPNANYKSNAYARSLSNDAYDMKAEFEFDLANGSALGAGVRLGSRLLSLSRTAFNEKIDSYDAQDKAPFYHEVKQFYGATIGDKLANARKLDTKREQMRLLKLLYSKQHISIKFVCYGNIMRSPMAALSLDLLCKQVGLNWSIDSFGFHQNQQRPSPSECVSVARKIGIDLSQHRSKWLSQNDLSSDDIVFIFDDKNARLLNSYYDCKYAFNVAHFVPQGLGVQQQIDDPYEAGEEAVQRCYLLIVEAMKNILEQYMQLLYQEKSQ